MEFKSCNTQECQVLNFDSNSEILEMASSRIKKIV